MVTMTANLLLELTAEDVMTCEMVAVPRQISLREAARLLRRAQVCVAPVVDEEGRCVGMLAATEFLHWAEDGCPDTVDGFTPACPYQVKGRLLTGEEAVICTLAEGACPLQVMRATTAGRHTALCTQPDGVFSDWQQVDGAVPSAVVRYMTTDIVSVAPRTPLPEVAQIMVKARTPHVLVLNEECRPVGVVSAADILAALNWEWLRSTDRADNPVAARRIPLREGGLR